MQDILSDFSIDDAVTQLAEISFYALALQVIGKVKSLGQHPHFLKLTPNMSDGESMNPIVKLAANALPGEKKYVLFAGAGVSKDAGIPTSWDLMMKTASLLYVAENKEANPILNKSQIEDWFLQSDYAKMEYAELMDILYPTQSGQQSFLREYLNGHPLGDSHRGIAELARREIIRAIITTNFDNYIEKALEEKKLDVQVISTDEDLEHSEPLIHCRSIRVYKPHGDLGRGKLKNTPRDIEKLSPVMEEELIRVLSEHGVIVLGYSGRDKGIQEVLSKRKSIYYPLFWVDPCMPNGEIEAILKSIGDTYIQCKGAGQFIADYIKLTEKIEGLAPGIGLGPTIFDIRRALSSPNEPIDAIFAEFLKNIFSRLQASKPDFTKFAERDDGIVQQINDGLKISYDFIEVALEAARYKNTNAIKKIYEFFGDGLKLYDIPDNFSGSFYRTDFDGYKFLVYEMFVSFIAALIKYNLWDNIPNLLEEGLLINRRREGGYVPYNYINEYIASLDQDRNNRLHSNRVSVTADFLMDRFSNSKLSELIEFQEFMEADYFIFIRAICHADDLKNLRRKDTWVPHSCIYLSQPPSYLLRAESKRFLETLASLSGCKEPDIFIEKLKMSSSLFRLFWPHGILHGPLAYFKFEKLGSWP